MKARCLIVALTLCCPVLLAQEWPQWALNPLHSTQVGVAGQSLNRNLVNLVYDPLVPDEMAANIDPATGQGDLLAHYQAPLVDGSDVYMMFKSGMYKKTSYATQNWGENKFTWRGRSLVPVWSFTSDWKAPGNQNDFWEPVFHPALANGSLYVPGAGGSIFKVNESSGTGVRINPFVGIDSNTYTAGPISVDGSGNLYYNVIQIQPSGDWFQKDVVDSWLVKVSPNDAIQKVSYSLLTPGTPRGTDLCMNAFSTTQLPWPPSPTAVAPSVQCGTERPPLNIAPAIASDGTIYTLSRAHFISRWAYLVAVNPDLTPKWVASLRDRFKDGCGVPFSVGGTLPANGAPGGCRAGANYGVDPATNTLGGGRIYDDGSSTAVVAPDGSIVFGAFTRYNYDQGHMMHFSATGQYLGGFNFGWDVTPGIYLHDGTYSIVTKDNHYGEVGSYCNDEAYCPSADSLRLYPEEYFVTQLSPNVRADALADRGDLLMTPEWSYKNTNTLSCTRNADGSVTCVSDHPHGFEWCVNAFVIDKDGVVYANSEDGHLYAIRQGGTPRDVIFQQLALGAAYTPTSIDGSGRIYSQNAGHLFVVGK